MNDCRIGEYKPEVSSLPLPTMVSMIHRAGSSGFSQHGYIVTVAFHFVTDQPNAMKCMSTELLSLGSLLQQSALNELITLKGAQTQAFYYPAHRPSLVYTVVVA